MTILFQPNVVTLESDGVGCLSPLSHSRQWIVLTISRFTRPQFN